jgi:hypothetical protein
MAISYSDIVDPQVIEKIIGADYQNEARLVNSGIIDRQGLPPEGTHVSWIKETLFSGDEEGQAIGVNTEISLKSKVQVQYQLPVFDRADGAELDDISEEIMAKRGREGVEADMANAISAKAAQMVDSAGIKIIDGSRAFVVTDGNNYNNANGSQANLVDLEETKATRGEKGTAFDSGFMIMRGLMYHKLASLGLVAATSNTMGNMAQDEIVRGGLTGTILNMNLFSTDKIALETGGDHFIVFIERGALKMLLGATPNMDPVLRDFRSFKSISKFRVKMGGVVSGLSWGATQSNPANTTNTALATGTNWSQAVTNIKNLPMAVVRFDAPTF